MSWASGIQRAETITSEAVTTAPERTPGRARMAASSCSLRARAARSPPASVLPQASTWNEGRRM